MQLEFMKPKVQLIDGIPAYNYGEWPGQHSNKFSRMKSCARPKQQYPFPNNGKK